MDLYDDVHKVCFRLQIELECGKCVCVSCTDVCFQLFRRNLATLTSNMNAQAHTFTSKQKI